MCKYTTIFCIVDKFCKIYEKWVKHQLLKSNKQRFREGKLSLSEQLAIMIFYHCSAYYKHLKAYYQNFIVHGNLFRHSPCYERFVQLIPSLFLPLMVMLHYLSGKRTGIYYADSTHFAVCKNIRINTNRTFNKLAKRGRSSVDWFFGFKLHMIINDKGEIIAVKITTGNVDDRIAFEAMVIKKGLKGKCYADKGFISGKMLAKLYKQGLIIITGIRKDMKNYLLRLCPNKCVNF